MKSRIAVTGRVQGVAYRAFVQETARRMGLRGGVRNLGDGRVEVEVEGDRTLIETFLDRLREGPPLARVDHLDVQWHAPTGHYQDFRIWY